MSFYENVNFIIELAQELEDYSCDLDTYIDEIINNASALLETYVCVDCGRILSNERTYISNNNTYCKCCYDDNKYNIIKAYHESKGTLKFKNLEEQHPIYYRGVEVELETDINDNVYAVLNNSDSSFFRFEEDGSLNSGFEIITAPMSRLYWNELGFYKLEKLINDLKEVSDPAAWDTNGRCGLHVHFNRIEISNEAQKVLKQFMINNHKFIAKMSGRDDNGFEYCRNPIEEDYELDMNKEIYNYSRYLTLNFTPNTLEFRFWRGTLKTENINSSVQLTEELIKFAELVVCNEYKPTESDFIKYIRENRPELNSFKNERRARWNRHHSD